MTDEADYAAELQEKEINILIERARKFSAEVLPISSPGKCLNCFDRIPLGRFCDVDCRTDYQKRSSFLRLSQ